MRIQSDNSRDSARLTDRGRPFCAHFGHRPSVVAALSSGRQAATLRTPASACDMHQRVRWARAIATAKRANNLPPHEPRVPGLVQRLPRNDVRYNGTLQHARADPDGTFLRREMRPAFNSRHVVSPQGPFPTSDAAVFVTRVHCADNLTTLATPLGRRFGFVRFVHIFGTDPPWSSDYQAVAKQRLRGPQQVRATRISASDGPAQLRARNARLIFRPTSRVFPGFSNDCHTTTSGTNVHCSTHVAIRTGLF